MLSKGLADYLVLLLKSGMLTSQMVHDLHALAFRMQQNSCLSINSKLSIIMNFFQFSINI